MLILRSGQSNNQKARPGFQSNLTIISRACGNYSFHDDRANGNLAFTLPGLTEEEADDLVDKLNAIRPADSPEGKADWYLGDRNEEYVHCN